MRIIKILTDKDVKDFNRAAPKHEIVIAGFFMVKCPACEAFKPEWEKFVDSCKSEGDPKVLIAEIDSNQASRVNFDTSALEGFPTVYRDVKGEEGVVEFKHERTKKALRRFLKEAMAAKGGRKKRTRRSKKKRKKRRKSRRKKKKGGVINNSCALASNNPPEATRQEAHRYCQDMLDAPAKCKLSGAQKGQCQKLSPCDLASDNPPEATPQEADRYCQDMLETRFAQCKLSGAQKGQCQKLSSCALASNNPPEATPQEAERYCQDMLKTRFAKCKLIGAQKGQCRKLSQDEINLLMYIDPKDARIANRLLRHHNNPMHTRVQLRSSSSDALKAPPLVRSPARQSHSPANPLDRVRIGSRLNPNTGEFVPRQPRPPPPPPLWARQPQQPPRPPPPDPIIQPPTFEYQGSFGSFPPGGIAAMAALQSDPDNDSDPDDDEYDSSNNADGGYKRKKRKTRRKKKTRKRRKKRTKRKRH